MTDSADWYTMQQLKKDIQRLRKEPGKYQHEIAWDEDCLKQLKQKAIVQ